ncbi:cathepsin L2-like, partial [Pogona vitticeps]
WRNERNWVTFRKRGRDPFFLLKGTPLSPRSGASLGELEEETLRTLVLHGEDDALPGAVCTGVAPESVGSPGSGPGHGLGGLEAYLEGEEFSRRAIWEENLRMIEQHNWEASQGKHTYQLGMNHFGDLTDEEFNQRTSCLLPDEVEPAVGNVSWFHDSATEEVPKSVDWRKEGYVSPVKSQGLCGSCWAFSATGALESFHFKKTGQRVSLSEQNLVDCSQPQGNNGCCGGTAKKAFEYVRQNGGLSSEQDYPYEERVKKNLCSSPGWATARLSLWGFPWR